MQEPSKPQPFYNNLTFRVIVAVVIGIILGAFFPETGAAMKPLGDIFIKMVKMIVPPIVFCTIVTGIAHVGDMRRVGKIGVRALIYFEVVTTLALIIGLVVVNLLQPGAGFNVAAVPQTDLSQYTSAAKAQSTLDFVMNIVPKTFVSALVDGELLQVLFIALLFAFGLLSLGERGRVVLELLERVMEVLFHIIGVIMKVAPIGAFGAIAFTIGKFGLSALIPLAKLMLSFYLTCFLFVSVVLWAIARWYGFSLWRVIRFIKDEFIIVLGTASSESVLPRMMQKLQRLGCSRSIVGLVLPTGYSFNLDGTCIYLVMGAMFIAQAYNIPLSLGQQLSILALLLLTSKGAATVTGAGFVTLTATISATGLLPVEGMALLLGVNRFMSEAMSTTNLVGNTIATIVIAKSEGELDEAQMAEALAG
ncbi:MAG: C4-dicarboxylate transporter DctA [Candidatus Kapabacteria bacterium]|jgi:aerobic C4-dicarboxylate transport protein|nr:C4-dicarboxylate transporter DctA [Candidatus Kapabacteria bacterium]